MKTVWDFVEQYYPSYTGAREIAHNDDLQKLMYNEHEKGSDADVILIEIYDDDRNHPQLKIDYYRGLSQIYELAIEEYSRQTNPLT